MKAVVDEIRHHLDGRHFYVVIRYSIKLAEAASHGVPIVDYCRHCAGFDDYQALAAEVLRQEADFPDAEPVAIRQNGSARNGRADQNEGADDDHEVLSAPASTPEGVMFTVEASDAEQVHLAGDFNDWTLDGSEMELIDGIWTKVVKLPPGRYRYRYVIDGQWQSDPLNTVVEPSAYGGHDSILVVAG